MKKILFSVILFVLSVSVYPQTTVFDENFEGTIQVIPTGTPAWSLNSTLQVSGTNSYQNVVGLNSTAYFETPTINFSGYSFISLTFSHICKIELADSARIFVSTDNGTSWQVLPNTTYQGSGIYFLNNMAGFTSASYTGTWLPGSPSAVPTNAWWKNEQFDVSSLVANQSQVKFRFYLKDGNMNGANQNAGWFIDDLKIVASFSELIPPVITILPPIYADTITSTGPFEVNASVTDASGISEANVVYNVNGLNQDTVPMVNVGGNTYMGTIPSFTYNNTVIFYVYAKDASPIQNYTQSPPDTFFIEQPYVPGANIALDATSTQSGGGTPGNNNGPEKYNDDYIGPFNCIPTPCGWGWVSTGGWIEYTWPDTVTFNKIKFYKDFRPMTGCTIQIWSSGSYVNVFNYSNPDLSNQIDSILFVTPHTTSKLRFFNIQGSNPNHREIQVFRPVTSIPLDYDAGVTHINSPASTVYTTALIPIEIRIKNFTPDTLLTATIEWTVDNIPQTPYNWTGFLLEDQVSPLFTIDSLSFTAGQHVIKAWTINPNSNLDQNNDNDTLAKSFLVCDGMLTGTYTIGSGGNYLTFQDAINALTLCGVSGPVVFNVFPGTYNERLVFTGVFPGATSVNTITFNGAPGTILQYSASVSSARAAVLLDGSKFLRLNNITVNIPDTSAFGQGFQLINGAEDIQITNCVINVNASSTATAYSGIVASGSLTSATTTGNSAHNILIQGNTINGGYYGIVFFGNTTTPLNNITIKNNTINSSYNSGIRTTHTNGLIIEGNAVYLRVAGGVTTSTAIYVASEYQTFNLSRNRIINAGGYGINVLSSMASTGRSLIANNEIAGFTNTASPYGIYLSTSSNIDVFYNSVNVNSGNGRAIYSLTSATGLAVKNNTFSYTGTGTGFAAYHTSVASLIEHNYNHYYSSGSNFVYYGSSLANLAALQAVNSPVGNDANSLSGEPVYLSQTNLLPLGHLLNNAAFPVSGITVDIAGNIRSTTTPDIGAYEFVPISADLAVIQGRLVRTGNCLSTNDSIYVKIKNLIGPAVDLSVDSVRVYYIIAGPVNSSGTLMLNNGIINISQTKEFGFDGIDMSLSGVYYLSLYIEPSNINVLALNDTLSNGFSINVQGETFNALPEFALVTNYTDKVPLTVNSNLFPLTRFVISEVCQSKTTTGSPSGGWPSYLLADDYIEISGMPNASLEGYKLEQWSTSALQNTHTFPAGTKLSPAGTAIIAVGQPGSSVASPANFYYHGNTSFTYTTTTVTGRILKNQDNQIVDAVGYGTYTFPAASGVTSAHWSGNTPAVNSGNRLVGPYTKTSANWIAATSANTQNPNTFNQALVIPQLSGMSSFSWSYNGVVTSTFNPDTIVGPWTTNGVNQYVASFQSSCGLKKDTVTIQVGVPPHDLRVKNITSPITNACSVGDEFVTIVIRNTGIDTLSDPFTASYKAGNEPAVTEPVNLTINPGDSVTYTFATPINFFGTVTNITFNLKTWATAVTDWYHDNDTLERSITLNYKPTDPVNQNDTVNYGQQATLVSTSNGNIAWYSTQTSTTPFFYGSIYTTPPLFNNTTYWTEARIGLAPTNFTLGTGTTTTSVAGVTPFTSYYEGVRIQYLVRANELIANGLGAGSTLNSLGFDVTASGPGTYPQLNYTLKIAHTTNTQINGAYATITGNWTTVYVNASEPAPAVGWKIFNFATPFEWDGVSNIVIDICHENDNNSTCGACYSTSSTVRYTATSFNSVYGRYNDNAPACGVSPSNAISTTYYTYRPNMRFISNPIGCPTDKFPVTAVVNLPAIDAIVTDIETPLNEQCSDNADIVSIRITNNGYDPIQSGLTATYKINNNPPVTETVPTVIPPGDTITFNFATPISLNLTSGSSTFTLKTWATHPQDAYHPNDTAQGTKKLNYTPPMPQATDVTIPYASSATLTAQAPGLISWYPSPTSDVLLDTGSIYQTPVLYGSTPYYVAAGDGSGSTYVGMVSSTNGTSGSGMTTYGLYFNALSAFTLKSVAVYPNATANNTPGTLTIGVINPSGTILHQATVNVTGFVQSTTPTFERVNLNFNIQPANNLRLVLIAKSTTISGVMFQGSSNPQPTYPYTIPGVVSITSGTYTGTVYPNLYYYFYNWEVGTGSGCQSDRAEVWALVDPATLPALDAGIVSIDEPVSPTNLQPQPLKVSLRNFGQNTLTSVDIKWSIDGFMQNTYNWTGSLTTGSIVPGLEIGTATFSIAQNDLKVWTDMPNGSPDLYNINDTVNATIYAWEPLCGNYTIGGPNADFPTFQDAIFALENYGVTCPVEFTVAQGVYNEQVVLKNYTGVSSTNTITFSGSTGSVLSFSPTLTGSRHVLKFDGAKHIIFQNMKIEVQSPSTYGWGIHITNNCENIMVKQCNIITEQNSTSTNYAGIVANGSSTSATTGGNAVNSLTLTENVIQGGYYGIILYGASATKMPGISVLNNQVSNYYYYGIYANYLNKPEVSGNIIIGKTTGTFTTSNYGIYFLNNDGPWKITKNNLTKVGLYGMYISGSGSTTTSSLIANNMIGGGFTNVGTSCSGIYLTSTAKVGIYYNSVNMNQPAGRGMYFLTTATEIDMKNNSLANTGAGTTGYAYYAASTASFTGHDYNNYYSNGSLFVYYGANKADLTALQQTSIPSGNDANSHVGNPYYYSSLDLHASTTQLSAKGTQIPEVTDDYDGETRNLQTPCIGADEFTPAVIDAAVQEGVSPSSGCGLSTNEVITVRIKNLGLGDLSSFAVSYSINGTTPVVENWIGNLPFGSSMDYSFTQTANLSLPGEYTIKFNVQAPGDILLFNDTLTFVVKTGHDFYSSDYFMGFEVNEDYSRWTVLDLNTDARTWEPGYNSATYAKTGTRSARFYNGTANPGNDYLYSECFTLEAGVSYKITFWYRVESATYPQNIRLVAASFPDPAYNLDTIVILQPFNNTVYQQVSGIFTAQNSGVYYFGWHAYSNQANYYAYIDDINIRILSPFDAGVVSIDNIDDMEDEGSDINMQVTVRNFGSQTLTSIPVAFSVNGVQVATQTWTGSLAPDADANVTFTTPLTVPGGDYSLCSYTLLSGDGNSGNDETCVNKYGLPVLTVPYFDDFEGTSFWYTEGTTTQWQLGEPAASIINSAYTPAKAWATQLDGNYANNSSYYLYSPKYDFSSTYNMVLGFWHWFETENGIDGGKVQYTTNGGITWTTLGTLNDPNGVNWYNTANINNFPAFSGSSGGWVYSEMPLAALNYFPIPVQFRFHFFSNASVNNNGWAIDDIEIFQPLIPNDAGVIAIDAPVGQTVTGAPNQVVVKLRNYGTQTLTSVPVTYRVAGQPPVNGTWTGTLAPNTETSFTFPTTFIGPFQSSFNLCAWTSVSGDIYKFNDTTCISLIPGPANLDGSVTEILSPLTETVPGSTVTVKVRVKNVGLQPLLNIPVQYYIDDVPQATEVVLGTLQPGAEADYTFITTFISPAAEYELCAKTSISGDAIISNDEICRDVIIGIAETEVDGFILMQNVPNPAKDETVIGFSLPGSGKVTLAITNVLGELIYTETTNYMPGRHSITVNTKPLSAGIYYYSLTYEQLKLSRKMIVH